MKLKYSNYQLSMLVVLRMAIGWHFLYEGVSKLLNPNWSSLGYLLDSKGFLSETFIWIATNPAALKIADFLNIWGLTAVGLGLILGLFTKVAKTGGIILLAFYYLSHPPFIGYEYVMPSEGSYLWINKTLVELITLWVLYLFPTGRIIGLDRLIFGRARNN